MEEVEKYLSTTLKIKPEISKGIFIHPKESRFNLLFNQLHKNRRKKKLTVDPKLIMLELDKRTSIIIKNIPDDITSEQFKDIILKFCENINFYYVPLSIRTRKNRRVAFINVINYKNIVPIYMGLMYKMNFVYNNPSVELEICYSKVQGRNELIKRFYFEFKTMDPNNDFL